MAFFDGNNSKVLLVALSKGTATITATTADGSFVATCVITVAAEEISDYSEGLEYISNGDGTCYVSGIGTCTDTEIGIPNSYDGETVVGIGKNAFANQYNILSVSLGDNILTIDERAFYNCRGLSNVDFNINLVSIGDSAFYNCAFTSVNFSDNITHIGEFAFNHCDELTTVTLSDRLTHIGKAAFLSCSAIKSISISCNVKSIGDAVFGGCESMTTIIVDEQNSNFCSIDGILYDKKISTIISCPATKTSVSIPSSVTVVGNDAFRECTALTLIVLPENVVKIGSTAFYECNNLKSINIPSGVIEIGDNAFYNCKNISRLTLPEGLEKIGNSAFWKCSQLTNINIPTTVTFIGGQAFESCKMLTKIIIPDSVTFIGYYSTFSDCKALTEITISCNISSLPNYAFRNCTSLTTINFSGTKNQWDSIARGVDWDENTGNYVINYLGEDDPTPSAPTTTATIVVDSKEVMPGETIKVNINLADNPGLASLVLKVSYTQSHYNNKEASNGAKYVSITKPFLKRILIPKERTKDTDGYIKVENRSKITISSLLLYLIGIIIVINIFLMMLIPQMQTKEIHVLIGGRLSHGDVVINTINSIVVYFSSLAFMILPLLVFFARCIYFGARAKNKTNSNLSN